MREIRSYGSVGERGGNEPLYPETPQLFILPTFVANAKKGSMTVNEIIKISFVKIKWI